MLNDNLLQQTSRKSSHQDDQIERCSTNAQSPIRRHDSTLDMDDQKPLVISLILHTYVSYSNCNFAFHRKGYAIAQRLLQRLSPNLSNNKRIFIHNQLNHHLNTQKCSHSGRVLLRSCQPKRFLKSNSKLQHFYTQFTKNIKNDFVV